MIKGTFCDWLINQGVRFHPDTVIVEASMVALAISDNIKRNREVDHEIYVDFHLERCAPIFDHMFVEYSTHKGKESSSGFYVNKAYMIPDGNHAGGIVYAAVEFGRMRKFAGYDFDTGEDIWGGWDENFFATQHKHYYHMYPSGEFDCIGGLGMDNDKTDYPTSNGEGICWHRSTFDMRIPEHIPDFHFPVVLSSMSFFHQRAEIELVDYNPKTRRLVKRKTGKEPSPYFRIIAPGQPQKRYKPNGQRPKQIKNMPIHTVRGHFRHTENHPIDHFNGTRWIAAHTRGDEKLGKLVKHYKIRLPESESA